MLIRHFYWLILSFILLSGCLCEKSLAHDETGHVIETAKRFLVKEGIRADDFPITYVTNLKEAWIIIFSERSPHPPGTDLTVKISKDDGQISLIRGE